MNAVYIRMLLYFLAPVVALIPGIAYDQNTASIIIDLETAAISLSAAAVAVGAVFTKWGKK